jgi:mannose-1-phosphate guanylyltransferase / mannose-6-phosphate isomerase
MSEKIKSVILCGGAGTRLWPLSRESLPKQFIPLIGKKSLLDLTINRVREFDSLICVANENHRFLVRDSLSAVSDELKTSILLEPAGRNTAAAIVSVALMPGIKPSDLLLFLPSDHFIPNYDKFIEAVRLGIPSAEAGYIVTFGIQPSYPSTAYGYIQLANELSNSGFYSSSAETSLEGVYAVRHFIEKPDAYKAQELLLSGDCLWNAGIFLCHAAVLIDAFSKHAPDILMSCKKAMLDSQVDDKFIRPEVNAFLDCRAESIDFAVMEHFEKVAVVPFFGEWSDVGSWNAVAALSSSDEAGNRISGQGFATYSTNTYINAPHRPVVTLGVSNLIVVDTPDAVLVASADCIESVKDVVVELKKNKVSQASMHRRVTRPWGAYDIVDVGECFQVKRIVVKPGSSLSLQTHKYRAEHWIVVKGLAKVTNGDKVFLLEENQSTYIPIGVKHRLENPGQTDLEMIEVQSGNYLGEDDIIRFEDTYGRS